MWIVRDCGTQLYGVLYRCNVSVLGTSSLWLDLESRGERAPPAPRRAARDYYLHRYTMRYCTRTIVTSLVSRTRGK